MRRSRPKPLPEEGIAIRVVVLVAVVASAWAALDETATGTALHVVVLGGLPLGFAFSYLTRRRTGWVLKTLLTVGLLLAFAQFLRAVGQLQGQSVSDVQTPLAELFIWVQLLHAFDVPGRRDLMFSLASSAVLAAIAGVLSVSLTVAPLLVVWSVASIAGLALAHRSSLAELPSLASVETRARDRRVDLGWMRLVLATIVAVVVLGTGLFMVVPTAGTARAGATVVRALVLRRARRRSAGSRPWGAIQLERFGAIGAARGRTRRSSETVREFADALDDPALDHVAMVIERELYSGRPAPSEDRTAVESALTAATNTRRR